MRIRLTALHLTFRQGPEAIPLSDFRYFYGKMGAGKSSIARLIDYCLGGSLDLSPALQSEFVAAALHLVVGSVELVLTRNRQSDKVHAHWTNDEGSFDVIVPARKPAGEVLPKSGVENLSDLLFHLAGIRPPRVRRSKLRDDSDLGRLSIRDLLWYCYLDQDSMDSSFFHLDHDADQHKRLKSRDVLRYVVGFHQERVAELELRVQELRDNRVAALGAAKSLEAALTAAGVGTEEELNDRVQQAVIELQTVDLRIAGLRRSASEHIDRHAADSLRQRGRLLAGEIASVEDALVSVKETIAEDVRHRNELQLLGLKFKRASTARAVLQGVQFVNCPRCTQPLPPRAEDFCALCGQPELDAPPEGLDIDSIERDADARMAELGDAIERHRVQERRLGQRLTELSTQKQSVDAELSRVMADYDSLFLASALESERRRAWLDQEIGSLRRLSALPLTVKEAYEQATKFEVQERSLREDLREASAAAERDTQNLRRLEELFLECLVRIKMPGIAADDSVSIHGPSFLPEVVSPISGDLATTSFSNLSSGGKKTLFKCCFALALHRLAREIGANLPTLLIIDSPAKNISERENKEQFEGFCEFVYELTATELSDTQVIVIDKEFCAPFPALKLVVHARHMTPDQDEHPPLIRYYRGP